MKNLLEMEEPVDRFNDLAYRREEAAEADDEPRSAFNGCYEFRSHRSPPFLRFFFVFLSVCSRAHLMPFHAISEEDS